MTYRIAVRVLCEFTAKAGDLDLRFTPRPRRNRASPDIARRRHWRSAGYQAELSLQGEYAGVQVRGRADGYDPQGNVLEEVKTYRGDFTSIPANHRQLHWAQARVYGWLVCQSLQLPEVNIALVYFDIVSEQETRLQETWTAAQLQAFFNQQCMLFGAWAEQESQHRQARDDAARTLAFPMRSFAPASARWLKPSTRRRVVAAV